MRFLISTLALYLSVSAARDAYANECEQAYIDHIGGDVQVTQTRMGIPVGPSFALGNDGHLSTFVCGGNDCTAYLAERSQTPMLAPIVIHDTYAGYFFEIQYAVKKDALRSKDFQGIGFWTSLTGLKFIPKREMERPVRRSNLKDGTPVSIFRAAVVLDEGFVKTSQTLSFKPYALFRGDSTLYRVWENFDGNHTVGLPLGLEMQRDILK